MTDKLDLIVFIGRFQPPHKAHIEIIETACSLAEKVLVMIGSSFQERTLKNPFTFSERHDMIKKSVSEGCLSKLVIDYNFDTLKDDVAWVERVKIIVGKHSKPKQKIALIGHAKDLSSEYLKWFPEWKSIDMNSMYNLNSSDIRRDYFKHDYEPFDIINDIPLNVYYFLSEFRESSGFKLLLLENIETS